MMNPSAHRLVIPMLLACLTVFATSRALAQDKAVTVQASAPASAYVGDTITFQISVRNARTAEPPDLSQLADFDATFAGIQDTSSNSTIIINGQRSDLSTLGCVLVYTLVPRRAGLFTIPALAVTVGNGRYVTDPVTINVQVPSEATDYRLTLAADHSDVFVGQPVRVTMTWALGRPVRGYALTIPYDTDDFDSYDAPDPRPPGTSPQDPRYNEIVVGSEKVVAVCGKTQIDGHDAATVSVDRILVPKRPGAKVRIGPARADFNAVVGERQRGFFDSPFEDMSVKERQSVSSSAITLNVSPLPGEGRPPNFSGLVGAYSVSASADPTDAAVGDPITLRVFVNGPAPLSLIPPIDLSRQPGLPEQFKLPKDPTLPEIGNAGAAFTQTIRARTDRVAAVPPIELAYFDTDARAYKVARSATIPLHIRSTGEVALPGGTADTASPAPGPESRPGGIAPIERAALTVGASRFDLTVTPFRPVWAAVMGAPVALYAAAGAAVLIRRRAERDPAAARRRRAHRRAMRALATRGGDSRNTQEIVSKAVCAYVADVFNLPEAGFTPQEAAAAVAGRSPELAHRLDELLRRCDESRFGGQRLSEGAGNLTDAARALINDLSNGPGRES